MIDIKYYNEMLQRERVFHYRKAERMVCAISYYICEAEDLDRIISADPFQPIEDRNEGKICYVAVLLTDKTRRENARLSYEIWHKFKDYIRAEYPSTQFIYWRRFDKAKNKVNTFIKKI